MNKLIKFSDDQIHHLNYLWRERMFSLDDLNKLLAEQAEHTRKQTTLEVLGRINLNQRPHYLGADVRYGYSIAETELNKLKDEIKEGL